MVFYTCKKHVDEVEPQVNSKTFQELKTLI